MLGLTVKKRLKVVASIAAAMLSLSACSVASSSSIRGGSEAPLTPGLLKQVTPGSQSLYVMNTDQSGNLSVNVYDKKGKFVRIVPVNPGEPTLVGFTVSSAGQLYVPGAENHLTSNLNIYRNQGKTITRTLAQKHSFVGLTTDSLENLYTLCASDRVCEFNRSRAQIVRRFANHSIPIATDPNGDVAMFSASGGYHIDIYATGKTTPYWTIPNLSPYAVATAFDSSGNLYVALGPANTGAVGSISVYAPHGTSPSIMFTIKNPTAIAIDPSSNLYVLSGGDGENPTVTEYAQGGSTPVRTITDGIRGGSPEPGSGSPLAVDSQGNLYVANEAFQHPPGNVTVYAPGATSPTSTISSNLYSPIAIGL